VKLLNTKSTEVFVTEGTKLDGEILTTEVTELGSENNISQL
jgi:hypothetical protein